MRTPPLLDDNTLEQSEVVANAAMNRERGLLGVNSYAKDLGFDPLRFLTERLETQPQVAWLDLCCGTGKALIQAALCFESARLSSRVRILGIDLVPMFASAPAGLTCLRLQEASAATFHTIDSFDLITCVHGLHYIGDNLEVIRRAASRLNVDGLFLSHLDAGNLQLTDGSNAGGIVRALRQAGLEYNPKRRLLSCRGKKTFTLPLRYLGADAAAGPNYTGQPAVTSYYAPV